MSLREPAHTPESSGQEPPMPSAIDRKPDRFDRLIAFFGWFERNLRWIVLVAIGAWVWYLGAIFTTTALLRNSAAAQTFFVNLLAEMQWSGYTILVLIGLGMVLTSLIQLILWPQGWAWRWLTQRLGRPVAWAATLLWTTTVLVESLLHGWGFGRWALPWFVEASARLGLTPMPNGLLFLSLAVAPLVTLLPEWCVLVALRNLTTAWRTKTAAH
jgi:hypothetical protein